MKRSILGPALVLGTLGTAVALIVWRTGRADHVLTGRADALEVGDQTETDNDPEYHSDPWA
jgi:hypothetical protein